MTSIHVDKLPGFFKQRSIEVTSGFWPYIAFLHQFDDTKNFYHSKLTLWSKSNLTSFFLLNRRFFHLTACDLNWPNFFLIEIHRVLGQQVLQHMGDITAAIRLLKVWVRFRNLATLLCWPFHGYKTFTLYNYAIRKRLKLLNRASLFFLDCVISHIFNP